MSNYDLGVDLDFNDVKGVADEGMYLMRCIEAEIRQTKGKESIPDAKNLFLIWEINKPEEWVGAPNVVDNLSLSKAMRRMLKEKLEGMTGKPWDQANMRIVPRDFLGMFAWAALTVDKYNDRDINKVRQYFPDSNQAEDDWTPTTVWQKTEEPENKVVDNPFPWMAEAKEGEEEPF